MTTTYHQSTSDGSATLGTALRIAIWDYQRRFGHEPSRITIPFWRGHEMPAVTFKNSTGTWTKTFMGIPFDFSTESDVIELR